MCENQINTIWSYPWACSSSSCVEESVLSYSVIQLQNKRLYEFSNEICLFVSQMKEEGVTNYEEIIELQIRNSCWRKSIDSTCFSVEAGKKPFSRRAAQQLLTFRPSDVVTCWECLWMQKNEVAASDLPIFSFHAAFK